VKPIIQGKPASGYVLAAVRASPIAVVARGPVSVLRKLAEIETQPIDIATYSESKEIVADLVTPSEREGEAESKLSLEPSVVNLALDIRPKKESRSFPRLPIAARQGEGEASGVALEPGVVTVVVASNDKKLAQLQEGEIRVFVDVSKAPTANSRLPVVVELPEGMMVEKVTPEAVRVVQK
jgi:YbbR domain-containing protein